MPPWGSPIFCYTPLMRLVLAALLALAGPADRNTARAPATLPVNAGRHGPSKKSGIPA